MYRGRLMNIKLRMSNKHPAVHDSSIMPIHGIPIHYWWQQQAVSSGQYLRRVATDTRLLQWQTRALLPGVPRCHSELCVCLNLSLILRLCLRPEPEIRLTDAQHLALPPVTHSRPLTVTRVSR